MGGAVARSERAPGSAVAPMSGKGAPRRVLRGRAPAKINLGLRVTGRRGAGKLAGYHELESVFLPLDLADEVVLELAPGEPRVALELGPGSPADVPAGPDNLAWRAAEAFLAASGVRCGVRIRLHKEIPARAGLGGGSSDAGAVLRLLAAALPGALPEARLRALALSLGADVPFFLEPAPALVTGVGERVEPLAALPSLSLVLAAPRPRLETVRVFEAYRRSGVDFSPPGLLREAVGLLAAPWAGDPGRRDGAGFSGEEAAARLRPVVANDLEAAARALCPALVALRGSLERSGALAVGMTGSGPTLFGIFRSPAEARLAAALPELAAAGFVRTASTGAAPGGADARDPSPPRG